MPGGDRPPAGVVYPASTADVQRIVRAANAYKVALYPISTGNNIGLGSRSATSSGQVVVDLGRNMNRILDIDEKLAFAVVEPGVSYQALYDELVRRGNRLMLDVTSGPPQGGMIGNALDKGAGYSPYFDHFGFACGLEIVLGNGEVLRTGDGALDAKDQTKDLINWHASKYSFGPILDGLFAQSNYGIVTRMGCGCCRGRRRSARFILPFRTTTTCKHHRALPAAEALEFRADIICVANDLYLCGSEGESPEYRTTVASARSPMRVVRHCASATGSVPGTCPGHSMGPAQPRWSRRFSVCATCSGRAARPATSRTKKRRRFRPCKSPSMLSPACPAWASSGFCNGVRRGQYPVPAWNTDGRPRRQRLSEALPWDLRRVRDGLYGDECLQCALCPRPARYHLQPRRPRRAQSRGRLLPENVGRGRARGVFVGRAPVDYHDFHMRQAMPAFRDACAAIKTALDPNDVIAPGRYGIVGKAAP